MPKIHFACLYGVDYDMDLLLWWADYYLSMKLDSYTLFLNSQKHGYDVPKQIRDLFRGMGFRIHIVVGPVCDGVLRNIVLGRYASTLPPEDMLVTADDDEFQCSQRCCPESRSTLEPPDYRSLEQSFDIITGFMQDRYGSRIEACRSDPLEQYPFEEPFTGKLRNNFIPPFCSGEWELLRRYKILACRAGYPVNFIGSHAMTEISSRARIVEEFKILHFCWREGSRSKMAEKTFFNAENLQDVYGGEVPAELSVRQQITRLERAVNEKT